MASTSHRHFSGRTRAAVAVALALLLTPLAPAFAQHTPYEPVWPRELPKTGIGLASLANLIRIAYKNERAKVLALGGQWTGDHERAFWAKTGGAIAAFTAAERAFTWGSGVAWNRAANAAKMGANGKMVTLFATSRGLGALGATLRFIGSTPVLVVLSAGFTYFELKQNLEDSARLEAQRGKAFAHFMKPGPPQLYSPCEDPYEVARNYLGSNPVTWKQKHPWGRAFNWLGDPVPAKTQALEREIALADKAERLVGLTHYARSIAGIQMFNRIAKALGDVDQIDQAKALGHEWCGMPREDKLQCYNDAKCLIDGAVKWPIVKDANGKLFVRLPERPKGLLPHRPERIIGFGEHRIATGQPGCKGCSEYLGILHYAKTEAAFQALLKMIGSLQLLDKKEKEKAKDRPPF